MTLVQCSGLAKHYGRTRAIDALELDLPAGPPIALIGPNGAGKTTLLSLLCGYVLPTQGSVSVMGHSPGSRALHGKLAALPQDALLDPRFSVRRQLRLLAGLQNISGSQATAEVARVLDLVQLSDSAEAKPTELSHGMRKRIAIAQLLLGKPALALLDEPTAGLDPPNVRIIRDLISSNAADTTFIISSHNLDELEKVCESVVFLEAGRLSGYMPIDDADDHEGYLTIRLNNVDSEQFQAKVQLLDGVRLVQRKEQGDFIIEYDLSTAPELDQALLRLLAENHWRYKHLVKGKTLEDRLFV
ncbi:MAG: ABC transporter ATP-binding protein [Gammaproteobacteria bacterium]|nr:ABC transporter ATP-binding protein [Gammaproteobacteria bacterium]